MNDYVIFIIFFVCIITFIFTLYVNDTIDNNSVIESHVDYSIYDYPSNIKLNNI